MKLLITGIAGFIGSKIAEEALKRGYKVIGVDDLSQGYLKNVPVGADFLKLDLINPENMHKLPRDIDYILHLAGQSSGEISFDNPVRDLEKNAISTLNLIKFGIQNNVKKILYASSMSVYGVTEDVPVKENHVCVPLSCYGVGKLAAENYLKVYQDQLPFTIFRMFNVYGPGQDMTNLRQGMVSIYLAHIMNEDHIPIKGGLERFRDFIFIEDVINIWLLSMERLDAHNQCFNLGTGVKTTVLELLNEMQKILPGFTWSQVPSTRGDQFGIHANMSKIKEVFGYANFVPLREGLSEFVSWIKKNQNL